MQLAEDTQTRQDRPCGMGSSLVSLSDGRTTEALVPSSFLLLVDGSRVRRNINAAIANVLGLCKKHLG